MTRTRGGTKGPPFLAAFAGIVLSASEYPVSAGPTEISAPAPTRFPAFTVRGGAVPTVGAGREKNQKSSAG
ncbi:hypothetical protein ACFC08_20570, partial [Streptomyces sp. NPDC056112]|uniref:hypothetical protein n=1 Tax=Streptomyces sp. NPDC056112 TaxID=3345715 RepID=UPI0035DCA8DE